MDGWMDSFVGEEQAGGRVAMEVLLACLLCACLLVFN